MELSYWESRWRKNKTGFHMPEGYPGLEIHWQNLQPETISRVLVPLCGKSLDVLWLSQHADTVIGVEIAEEPITGFMNEHDLTWEKNKSGRFTIYKSGNIQFWRGDFMKLSGREFPGFDLIYDKAALSALPPDMRKRYADKILSLSDNHTRYLLHHVIYRQEEMNGPPFSVSHQEISENFGSFFQIKELNSTERKPEEFPGFVKRGLQSPLIERFLLLKENLKG